MSYFVFRCFVHMSDVDMFTFLRVYIHHPLVQNNRYDVSN